MSDRPKLRVGVIPSTQGNHEAVRCYSNLPRKPCARPGFEMEIFDGIMKLLGWDYEFVKTSEFGEPNPFSPGNWTGLVGLVQSGQIDVSAVTARVTQERQEVVDFSFPAWYYQQTYIIRQPAETRPHRFLFQPYETQVWMYFAVVLLLVSMVEWLIAATIRFSGRPLWRKVRFGPHAVWNSFAILLKQNEQDKFGLVSSIILAKIWVVGCLVMVTCYQSIMYSLLAVPLHPRIPFRTMAQLLDLLERNEWHLTYPYGKTLNVFPECPSVQSEQRLMAALEHNPVRKDSFVELTAENSRAVYYGTDYLHSIPHPISWHDRFYKWIMIRDDSVSPKFGSFLFQKGSPYRHRFDAKLVELLPGMATIKHRYENELSSIDTHAKALKVKLTLAHFRELLIMFGVGCLISVVSFLLELYGWWWRRCLRNLSMQGGPITLLIQSQNIMVALPKNRQQQDWAAAGAGLVHDAVETLACPH